MEKGEFPLGTAQFFEYRFGFKVGGLPEPGLHIVWFDYPGGWWERTPKDDSEKAARRDALAKLLTSHVGILLVDGMKYVSEGLPYVRHQLDQFATGLPNKSRAGGRCAECTGVGGWDGAGFRFSHSTHMNSSSRAQAPFGR